MVGEQIITAERLVAGATHFIVLYANKLLGIPFAIFREAYFCQ
jgi:hypothetical protein